MEKELTPVHIQLKKGDISDNVLIGGDPERIIEIAKLLENPKLLWTYRYTVYSGRYKNKSITLASHGIGAPSLAIAVEELHALGGKNFVRLGTCGGMKETDYGDLVIPDSAFSSGGGTMGEYIGINDSKNAFEPDEKLTTNLIENTKRSGAKYITGPVFSTDAFFVGHQEVMTSKMKMVAIEMECATLFMLGRLRKFRTASLLLVVDKIMEQAKFLSIDEMHRRAKNAASIVLDTLTEY